MQPESTFQEKQLERIPYQPEINNAENDILWVKNIDLDCDEETYDSVRYSERFRDQVSGRTLVQFVDRPFNFNHAEGFQVRWSGQPFTIKPGEVAKMPRFLAEHFATQLCNHMLDRLAIKRAAEQHLKEPRPLRNDPVERPRMLKQIILKEEKFFAVLTESVGEEALKTVAELNPGSGGITEIAGQQFNHKGAKDINLNEAEVIPGSDNVQTTVGRIDKDSVETTEDVIARLGTETPEDDLNVHEDFKQYSKADIIGEIRHMDPYFKFRKNYTKAQLVEILRKF